MCLPAPSTRALLGLALLLVVSVFASGELSVPSTARQRGVQLAPAAATTTAAMVPSFATRASISRKSSSQKQVGGWRGGGWSRHLAGSSRSRLDRRISNPRATAAAYGAGSLRCVCALPPPGISPLAWDAGVSTLVGAASIVWVKLWTGLARRDKMKPQVSRKVVHTTAAPLFVVLLPFFSSRPCARLFAAAVPLVQAVRLAAAGLSGDPENNDSSSNELVKAISRSGKASETLDGPLKYSLAIVLITVVEWRTSVVGLIAMMQMAVGDGMADLVGRQFGKHKWRKGGEKSVEGSAAFVSGSFVASVAMIQWFNHFGLLSVTPAEAAARAAAISFASAAVELFPPRLVGDDNISVPVTALILGRLLFRK